MKIKTLSIITMTVCISCVLTLPTIADSGHKHEPSDAQHHEHEHLNEHDRTSTASPAEVMKQIHELQVKLATTISEKKLEDVHHIAFAIRDLADILPSKAQADKKARVTATAKNIASIASALDESGDANDQLQTEANLKKLDGLVSILGSQVLNP